VNVTLNQEQYEALIALARRGCTSEDQIHAIESFFGSIERANGIARSALWIQWQEADQELPPTTRFPEVWPPEQRYYLEFISRPIARSDVDLVLARHARQPVTVLVTKDPAAQIGWTPVDEYFTA
jgi:hypothetical protein